MTSGNGRDAHILFLHRQGRTIRSIAREVGLSPSRVRQVIAAGDFEADDDGDIENVLAALADFDPEHEVVPPLTLVGAERSRNGMCPRWVDTIGSVSEMDIYRHRFRNGSEGDPRVTPSWRRTWRGSCSRPGGGSGHAA